MDSVLITLGAAVAVGSGVGVEIIRERRARKTRKEEEKAAFQREHLLALHVAMLEFLKSVVMARQARREQRAEEGEEIDPVWSELAEVATKITYHRVLVEDEPLRARVLEMQQRYTAYSRGRRGPDADRLEDDAFASYQHAAERLGELIRTLY